MPAAAMAAEPHVMAAASTVKVSKPSKTLLAKGTSAVILENSDIDIDGRLRIAVQTHGRMKGLFQNCRIFFLLFILHTC
jgi:hypothetical protein